MGWQNHWRWEYPRLCLWLCEPPRSLPLAGQDPVPSPLRDRLFLPLQHSPHFFTLHPRARSPARRSSPQCQPRYSGLLPPSLQCNPPPTASNPQSLRSPILRLDGLVRLPFLYDHLHRPALRQSLFRCSPRPHPRRNRERVGRSHSHWHFCFLDLCHHLIFRQHTPALLHRPLLPRFRTHHQDPILRPPKHPRHPRHPRTPLRLYVHLLPPTPKSLRKPPRLSKSPPGPCPNKMAHPPPCLASLPNVLRAMYVLHVLHSHTHPSHRPNRLRRHSLGSVTLGAIRSHLR